MAASWQRLHPWLIWGGLVLLLLGGCYLAGRWYNHVVLQLDADHLFETVLAGGSPVIAYQEADPLLQAFYPAEVFKDYFRRRSTLWQREHLTVLSVEWKRAGDDLYAVVRTRIDDGQEPAEVIFYCTQNARGNWRLAGISPDLLGAVPGKLQPMTGKKSLRKK